ncbi:putative C2 domain-containing protein [Helianthus annuus]|nr:putative C2 domain-containing protein [Helianthus annuus]KAJ0567579.1 putative C2 domain-containing protein [Helianthus annuus]KAJ0916037.1 putative C2 domain-containing protein [Helianthus annuus]
MSARYELEITISSARNLKNISWRHGSLNPYAVVWVDPKNKRTTHVDEVGDESPVWDEKLTIPFNDPIEDSTLYIDIVHANAAADTKPLIGSAKLKLIDVVDEVGMGNMFSESLELKRPSGRPHGKLEVKVSVKETRYPALEPYYPPPYTVAPQQYNAPQPYGGNYPYAAPPSGYPYAAPQPHYVPQYGQPAYGGAPSYGGPQSVPPYGGAPSSYSGPPSGPPYGGAQPSYGGYEEKKKSKFGIGTGLAVGAAAGLLGGLAIAEGVDYVEDKIAEDIAEKVEDDLGYDYD